jgi:hypothetical protein
MTEDQVQCSTAAARFGSPPHLTERLEEGFRPARRVTLISAPADTTSLLADLINAIGAIPDSTVLVLAENLIGPDLARRLDPGQWCPVRPRKVNRAVRSTGTRRPTSSVGLYPQWARRVVAPLGPR